MGDRRRTITQAVVLVVVVVLLAWGVDALARLGAGAVISRDVQNATGSPARPEVKIRGLLFLPQVIRGSYDEVDVSVSNLTSGPLRLARVDSVLHDVRVPFHDVLVQDVRRIGIGRSQERVSVRYTDLNAYLDATDRKVHLNPAPNGQAKLTGSVDILGQTVKVSGSVNLSVDNGNLTVTPGPSANSNSALDQATRKVLGDRLTVTVRLDSLPFGQRLTKVTPGPDSILVQAEGSDVVVEP